MRDDVDMSLANDCMKKAIDVLKQPGSVVPDTNQWRNEAFTTAQNAIFSDLSTTTPQPRKPRRRSSSNCSATQIDWLDGRRCFVLRRPFV